MGTLVQLHMLDVSRIPLYNLKGEKVTVPKETTMIRRMRKALEVIPDKLVYNTHHNDR